MNNLRNAPNPAANVPNDPTIVKSVSIGIGRRPYLKLIELKELPPPGRLAPNKRDEPSDGNVRIASGLRARRIRSRTIELERGRRTIEPAER